MHPGTVRSSSVHDWCSKTAHSALFDQMHFLFTMSDITATRLDLADEFRFGRARFAFASGGARRDRTDDLMLAKHALSQLSYGPKPQRSALAYANRRFARSECDAELMRGTPAGGWHAKNGGPGRTRTSDLTLIKRAL